MTIYTLDQIPAAAREAWTAQAFANLDDSPTSLAFRIRVWRDGNRDLLKRFAVVPHRIPDQPTSRQA